MPESSFEYLVECRFKRRAKSQWLGVYAPSSTLS